MSRTNSLSQPRRPPSPACSWGNPREASAARVEHGRLDGLAVASSRRRKAAAKGEIAWVGGVRVRAREPGKPSPSSEAPAGD